MSVTLFKMNWGSNTDCILISIHLTYYPSSQCLPFLILFFVYSSLLLPLLFTFSPSHFYFFLSFLSNFFLSFFFLSTILSDLIGWAEAYVIKTGTASASSKALLARNTSSMSLSHKNNGNSTISVNSDSIVKSESTETTADDGAF